MQKLLLILILCGMASGAALADGPFQTQLTVSSVIQQQNLAVTGNMTAPASGTVGTLATVCSTQSACSSPTYSFQPTATGTCSAAQIAKNGDFLLSGNTVSINPAGPDISGGGLPAGAYPVGITTTIPGTYNSPLCFPQSIVVNGPTGPALSVNGSTTGTTVNNGATFTVAVSGGPGSQYDTIFISSSGHAGPGSTDFKYVTNCGTSAPSAPYATSNSCTFTANYNNGSWVAYFAGQYGSPVYASAPFTVGSGGGTPSITGVNFNSTGNATITVSRGFSGTVDALTTVCSTTCPGTPSYSMASTGGPPTLSGITLSNSNFTCGTGGTVGQLTIGGAGNISAATLSLDSTSISQGFSLSSATSPSNLQVTSSPTGCPTTYNISVTATLAGAMGSPLTPPAFSVVGSGGGSGGGCTPAGSPCPLGVSAPPGYHWNMTTDDEFTQDTSLNTTLWCNNWGGGGVVACGATNGLSFDATNGLGITPPMGSTGLPINRGGLQPQSGTNPPAQLFGYWEWSAKEPTDVSGEGDGLHTDVFFHNGQPFVEFDPDEKVIGTGNRNYTYCNMAQNHGDTLQYPYPNTVNLDAAFHTYGMYWANTGGSGQFQCFFDGVPQNPPYNLVDPGWATGHPAFPILMVDGCPNPNGYFGGNPCSGSTSGSNPFYFKYWRSWQLVAGSSGGGGGGGTGCSAATSPCVAINGSTTGTTVAPGATVTVSAKNASTDFGTNWISFCTAGQNPMVSAATCADTAAAPGPYQWGFLQTCAPHAYPYAPVFDSNTDLSGSCSTIGGQPFTAPSTPGNYLAAWFSNDGYNGAGCGGNASAQTACEATAPFTVSSGGGGGPAVVQALQDHGIGANANGTQTFPWQIGLSGGTPIRTGDAVVGWVHCAAGSDTSSDAKITPQRIYDNVGNTYTQTAGMFWAPYGSEMINGWYATNIQGNPSTFYLDYTNYPASDGTLISFCEMGFVEYSGVTGVDFVGPVSQTQLNPTITISPSASSSSSLIWVFSATDTEDSFPCQDGGNGNMISPTGYNVLIDLASGTGVCVLGSPGVVGPGATTYTWRDTYYNAANCSDGSTGPCSTVMMGAAVH